MTPEHDYTKRPLQLFWLDGVALQAIAGKRQNSNDDDNNNDEPVYLIQVSNSDNKNNNNKPIQYPLVPPVKSMAEFKTTPMIHIGYATTWYGLTAAGIFMTRKLMTRGRG